MGLFDWLTSGDDSTYGYKAFKNTQGWDNEKMLARLLTEDLPYGTPRMGWIRAFGKERQVIVYPLAHDVNYVYVDAQPKKIIVSMAPKPGQVGGAQDHVDMGDVTDTRENFVAATCEAIEPANHVIKVVESILKG
ncbi:MAG: hypothetical protein J6Y08_08930 [Clostridiales bacterium]|nr:hypothetical protein [Clostridiales bacterium]